MFHNQFYKYCLLILFQKHVAPLTQKLCEVHTEQSSLYYLNPVHITKFSGIDLHCLNIIIYGHVYNM
jgi:hypothetical protein